MAACSVDAYDSGFVALPVSVLDGCTLVELFLAFADADLDLDFAVLPVHGHGHDRVSLALYGPDKS